MTTTLDARGPLGFRERGVTIGTIRDTGGTLRDERDCFYSFYFIVGGAPATTKEMTTYPKRALKYETGK